MRMALVDKSRALGGLERRVGDVGRAMSEARLSPSVLVKAAATLGLPNLVHHRTPNEEQDGYSDEYDRALILRPESCCSCTPLACVTSHRVTGKTGSQSTSPQPRGLCREIGEEGEGAEVQKSGSRCSNGDSRADDQTRTGEDRVKEREGEGEREEGEEEVAEGGTMESASCTSGEMNHHQGAHHGNREAGENRGDAFLNRRQPDKAASPRQTVPKTCRRRLVADYEKELTFRPQLSLTSRRMAAQTGHGRLPLMHRLHREQRSISAQLQENFTFCPKLNQMSLRLAQERAAKLPEIQARLSHLAAKRMAEACAHYTFHPQVSERSRRLAQRMETDFLARQQQHLMRRQGMISESHDPPQPSALKCHKRSSTITTSTSPSTPPHSHTPHTSHPTPKHPTPPKQPRETASPSSTRLISQGSSPSSPSSPLPSSNKTMRTGSPKKGERPRTTPLSSPAVSPTKQRHLKEPSSPSLHWQKKRTRTHSHTQSSPTRGVHSERGGGEGGTESTPQRKVPSVLNGLWSRMSELDRVKRVKILAERVMKEKKVFVCRGGYRTIRRALKQRGWVEKESNPYGDVGSPYKSNNAGRRLKMGSGCGRSRDQDHTHSDSSSDDDGDGGGDGHSSGEEEEEEEDEEYHMLRRAVRNAVPNFVWTLRREEGLYKTFDRSTLANHFAKASSFTTKVGLCTNLHSLKWYGGGDPNLFFPRCYLLSSNEERDSFISDYRFTAALNLLKLVVDQHWGAFQSPHNTYTPPHPPSPLSTPHNPTTHTPNHPSPANNTRTTTHPQNQPPSQNLSQPPSRPPSQNLPSRPPSQISTCPPPPTKVRPAVPEEAIRMALQECRTYLSSRHHEDIEGSQCAKLTEMEWTTLLQYYYSIVLEKGYFTCSSDTVRQASSTLDEMERYWPQMNMDGTRNIWIVKPGALSRGRGILCMNRLEPILDLVSSPVQKKEGKWVVQKYIERPLLIYSTKFDIRQWFLVTDWNPLTMWMYKDCYFRFATQKFTLDNMNESIHLCNNSIQKHYTNSASRCDLLPEENMWHSDTFRQYLQLLNQAHQWDEVIYPGMKHAIISVLQVAQDAVECRKNSFELYGADFMLTEDFVPWLIEINCSPTMEASTSVTSQLCREVMEDTIKVVLDRRSDRECSTGRFEMAFKQPKLDVPSYVGIQLCVEGMAIRSHTHHRSCSLPATTLSFPTTP